ncbi:hypothetical protein M0813_24187 [Anaeramoeba flamelloides]|uniref:Uncharacterized protein n=1 Tax=Anaeramoeba flamelloides TaxID=1746091 RepID=A0ABQ8Y786_9EUKA|nr:hypothetical protein M0813_24187 [Anaeramoeba flamelloides]
MGGKKFGVDQDEILIINVIKRIGWFWGGRAKRVHPKTPNSFDNINNNNFFYLRPLPFNHKGVDNNKIRIIYVIKRDWGFQAVRASRARPKTTQFF